MKRFAFLTALTSNWPNGLMRQTSQRLDVFLQTLKDSQMDRPIAKK